MIIFKVSKLAEVDSQLEKEIETAKDSCASFMNNRKIRSDRGAFWKSAKSLIHAIEIPGRLQLEIVQRPWEGLDRSDGGEFPQYRIEVI